MSERCDEKMAAASKFKILVSAREPLKSETRSLSWLRKKGEARRGRG